MHSNTLFVSLEQAGIKFSTRTTSRGVDYAGFQWSADNVSATQLTALLEEGVLRITAHEIKASQAPLDLLERANKFPLGATYISPEDGLVELSVGLFTDDMALSMEQLHLLLGYVDTVRRCLEGEVESCSLPQFSKTENKHGSDIIEVLASYGHQPQVVKDGASLEIVLSENLVCRLKIVELQNGWIHARAHYVPARQMQISDENLSLLQRLQRWATCGRFQLSEEGELSAEVYTCFISESRAKVITWTTSQVVILLRTAVKHFLF